MSLYLSSTLVFDYLSVPSLAWPMPVLASSKKHVNIK